MVKHKKTGSYIDGIDGAIYSIQCNPHEDYTDVKVIDGKFYSVHKANVNVYIPLIDYSTSDGWGHEEKENKQLANTYKEVFDIIVKRKKTYIECIEEISKFLQFASTLSQDTWCRDVVYGANKVLCAMVGVDKDTMYHTYYKY